MFLKVEIICVGTELLMGQITNTNATYISHNLPRVGLGVYYYTVVGDNPQRLKESVHTALNRCDIVIMTGGLGPTQDDLTKETVADALGLKMVLDQKSVDDIKGYFSNRGSEMVDSNFRQAYFPEGSYILRNFTGTAPGCIIEKDSKIVVMLPGPPKEMIPMFEDSVLPFFQERTDELLESRFVKVVGIGESALEDKLMPLIDHQTNPTFATYAKEGEVTIRVTVSISKNQEDHERLAQEKLDEAISKMKDILGDHIYSTNDETLEDVVFKKFCEAKKTFALAESCTGGMVASRMTAVPGVSEVFHAGVVTYSNDAKVKLVNVSQDTLNKYGAVSSQTAIEMAKGVRKNSGADVGLSVTGIAGPGGDSSGKPVGLVYIAVDGPDGVSCKELNFSGNRERIRNSASTAALDLLRRSIG